MSAPAPSMFTHAAKAMVEKLGLKMGRANLDEFAATLEELAGATPNIVAVTSDSRGSGKLAPFCKALPRQIVEVGIAEQNLVGITAGLAACGKKSFGVSPGCFLTARSLEQIKNDICYSDVPAVLIGLAVVAADTWRTGGAGGAGGIGGIGGIAPAAVAVGPGDDECLLVLGGTVTVGQRIKPTTGGVGIAATSDKDRTIAIAHKVGGVSGDVITVKPMRYDIAV